jgi:hypothetical protein
MAGAPTPQTLLEPIASDAASGYITNPIPDAPTGTNAASVQQGFPDITMTEELAGGEPPLGQDMNGFLFLISSHTMYVQCGQPYLYNSTLATMIGGYLAGTILGMTDGTGLWLNTVNGNGTNPDTGGAGWVPLGTYGFTELSGLTGGTVALTAAQAKYFVIEVQGALTSNLTLILPETIQSWLIANVTTGAFTVKVQTIAALASVLVPQGGFASPTGVYGVGDGNIYPSVAPLSVPIDQAPTPSTLAERTNTGSVLATVFNSNTAATNPTILNVIVDAGNGNFQKISLANFNAQTQPTAQILKSGQTAALAGGSNRVNFPTPFPNSCVAVVVTPNTNSATVAITARDAAGFNINTGAAVSFNYIATGT